MMRNIEKDIKKADSPGDVYSFPVNHKLRHSMFPSLTLLYCRYRYIYFFHVSTNLPENKCHPGSTPVINISTRQEVYADFREPNRGERKKKIKTADVTDKKK